MSSEKKDSVIKQKTVSVLPSRKEWHVPGGYNWCGPGTEIYNRITLNYTGKVGSNYFWLPVNKIDFESFRHDLAYYSENLHDHQYADFLFIKDNEKSLINNEIKSFISAQMISRKIYQTGKLSVSAAVTKNMAEGFLKDFKYIFTAPFLKGKGSIAGYFLNPVSGRAPPSVKKFFKEYLEISGTRRGRRKKGAEITFLKTTYALIKLIASGIGTNEVLKNLKEIAGIGRTDGFQDKVDSVAKKYKEYLDTLGEFDKAGEFVITKKGNSRKYFDFYQEFRNYISYVNKINKQEKYELPKINNNAIPWTEMEFSGESIKIEPYEKPDPPTELELFEKGSKEFLGMSEEEIKDTEEQRKQISEAIKQEVIETINEANAIEPRTVEAPETIEKIEKVSDDIYRRMSFELKVGKSVDSKKQAKALNFLFKGDFEGAVKEFSKGSPSKLRSGYEEIIKLPEKYKSYYDDNPEIKALVKSFAENLLSAFIGEEFAIPIKTIIDVSKKINYAPINGDSFEYFTGTIPQIPEKSDIVEFEVGISPDGQQKTAPEISGGLSSFVPTPVKPPPPTVEPVAEEDKTEQVRMESEATEAIASEPVGEAVQKIGLLAPHNKNATAAEVQAAIGETVEEQLRDLNNWFIFDMPNYSTGVGSEKTNPLVSQNEASERFMLEGTLQTTMTDQYLLTPGVEDIKDFYTIHADIRRSAIEQEMKKRKLEAEEDEFLASVTEDISVGMFNQYQTRAEQEIKQDIYQIPGGTYGLIDEYPFTSPFDDSMIIEDELRNKNNFPDGTVSF